VVFVPGCCEGFERARLDRLDSALRNGAWRDTDWSPLEVTVNGVPQPREGELPASPERGSVAASIRVTMAGEAAERVDVLGVDTTSDRGERVKEQVQSGELGEAVPYTTVEACRYDIDAAAVPALLDRLARGGVPRIPTRLRPDYTFAGWSPGAKAGRANRDCCWPSNPRARPPSPTRGAASRGPSQ
jgi:hypothetical protein